MLEEDSDNADAQEQVTGSACTPSTIDTQTSGGCYILGRSPPTTPCAPPAASHSVQPPERAATVGKERAHPYSGNNARMHPSNKYYRQEPDFHELAERYPDLQQYVSTGADGRAHFDYTSWGGTKTLTATLLAADFGIEWDLPAGALVPTVTNRANYIHWLSDLLALSSPPGGVVRGLDIGCGANFIYCLLGASLYDWTMVGVDVTQVALEWARRNIDANPHLAKLLELRDNNITPTQDAVSTLPVNDGSAADGSQQQPRGILTPTLRGSSESFAFCMCNPPFFESMREANANPHTACGGTLAEMVCEGGEVAFVMQMVEDSEELQGRIHWFTTMVGKKSTLKALRKELHDRRVTALRTTEFAQGKTSRWAVAWSFTVDRSTNQKPLRAAGTAQSEAPQDGAATLAPVAAAKSAVSPLVVAARQATFAVEGAKADGRVLLQLLQRVASAQGATCKANPALWSLSASLPPLGPAEQGGGGATPASCSHTGPSGPGPHILSTGVPGGSDQDGSATQANKRHKPEPAVSPGPAGASGASSSGVSIQLQVFSRQRGKFEVVVSCQGALLGMALTRFQSFAAAVRNGVALLWAVPGGKA
ncbi:MAG: hypothetical protein WDW36_005209 [Sanguina aurantia]